jgi:hypothetical protein
VKFLVDMTLSPDLAIWLRSQGHDAVHDGDLALNRAADTQILSIALDGKRVVISADLDFPRLLALAGAATTAKPKAWNASGAYRCPWPAEELPRSIVVVDHKSVRRRLLPI